MGKMVLTVLGMVAEMELGFIRDRQRAGIEAAKARGVYKGRPTSFDHAWIVALRKEGKGRRRSPRQLDARGGMSTRRSGRLGSRCLAKRARNGGCRLKG
jgi:DNA invertase Pin-like site-specific DNA recombinase